ncbi:hypothetical protein Hanom_Chr01g00043411 [Helianthus anomalus]
MLQELPTTDLHPRKRSRRDTRISREITDASSSTTEAKIPEVNASNSVSTTGIPVRDLMIEFLTNPKAAMYMHVPKTSERSSNGPSKAEVLRATTLLEQVVRESAATTEPAQEKAHEPASSPDSENLFGDVDIGALVKRITVLEEDKIFKDVEIASLLGEITHQTQQIQELDINLFAEPPKEYNAAEKEQMDKEREEEMNKYIQDPPRTVGQRMKQKEVVMRNVGSEKKYGFRDFQDRYIIKTGKDIFDRYENRPRIRSWVYNDEKALFLATTNNRIVEYYNSSSAFKS